MINPGLPFLQVFPLPSRHNREVMMREGSEGLDLGKQSVSWALAFRLPGCICKATVQDAGEIQ